MISLEYVNWEKRLYYTDVQVDVSRQYCVSILGLEQAWEILAYGGLSQKVLQKLNLL